MGNESSNSYSGSDFGQLGHDGAYHGAAPPPLPPPRRRARRRRGQTRRSQSAPGSLEKTSIQSDEAWNKEHAAAMPVDLDEVDATIRRCIAEFGPEPPRGGYARAARRAGASAELIEMARRCDTTPLQAGKVGGRRRRSRRKRSRRKRRRARRQRGGATAPPKPTDSPGTFGDKTSVHYKLGYPRGFLGGPGQNAPVYGLGQHQINQSGGRRRRRSRRRRRRRTSRRRRRRRRTRRR